MAVEFIMPKLGLTMTNGTIREWLVADGAMVNAGDAVLIIETDKLETEIEARDSGVLSISGAVGQVYECGDVIGQLLAEKEAPLTPAAGAGPTIREPSEPFVAAPARPASAPAATAADTDVRGEGGRILASPMARAAARNLDIGLGLVSGTGPDGRIVADDVTTFAESAAESIADPTPTLAPPESPLESSDPAAEAAPAEGAATSGGRMLGDLLGIDLRLVPPSSPGARVTRDDVAAWVRLRLAQPEAAVTEVRRAQPQSSIMALSQTPSVTVAMHGMRGLIAERMHSSLTEMAQLTLSVNADMTAINAERTRLRAAERPVPGYTAWVIAAASCALVDHPYVNSQLTADGVAYLPQVHVGVAVAVDDGLVVPVITNTNDLGVDQVHRSVAELAGRARDGKLTLSELEGGTFSVTALGMYGVDMFTPIINPPNTAILGVGRLRPETRWDDGVPSATTVMSLSLTWDHRAFDGAPAAEFAQSIVRYLENPAQLNG